MEGGGDSKEGKARLREGMAEFFRKVVAQKKPGWRIVACGSRNDAHDAFRNANRTSPENFNVLLVDSEEAVAQARSPRNHLQQRDGWDLNGVNDDSIHLMIRVMETWIVADAGAVAEYYQQHFLKKRLADRRQPRRRRKRADLQSSGACDPRRPRKESITRLITQPICWKRSTPRKYDIAARLASACSRR